MNGKKQVHMGPTADACKAFRGKEPQVSTVPALTGFQRQAALPAPLVLPVI